MIILKLRKLIQRIHFWWWQRQHRRYQSVWAYTRTEAERRGLIERKADYIDPFDRLPIDRCQDNYGLAEWGKSGIFEGSDTPPIAEASGAVDINKIKDPIILPPMTPMSVSELLAANRLNYCQDLNYSSLQATGTHSRPTGPSSSS